MRAVPTRHQMCLLESTQTEEIICMFSLALARVDWQMFLLPLLSDVCLSESGMMWDVLVLVLSSSILGQQNQFGLFTEVNCGGKWRISHAALAQLFQNKPASRFTDAFQCHIYILIRQKNSSLAKKKKRNTAVRMIDCVPIISPSAES